jgi:hypothetical protein
MPLEFKPNPLRESKLWKAGVLMASAEPQNTGLKRLEHAAVITCRDCFGFGHSSSKCPTARRFDEYR